MNLKLKVTVSIFIAIGIGACVYFYQNPSIGYECSVRTLRLDRNKLNNSALDNEKYKTSPIDTEKRIYVISELKEATRSTRKDYIVCFLEVETFTAKVLESTEISLTSELETYEVIDIDQDGDKDVLTYFSSNYEIEDMMYLWLSSGDDYHYIENFNLEPSANFNSSSNLFTSYMTVSPAKAGFIYNEFEITSDYKIRYVLSISREVLPTSLEGNFEFRYSLSTKFDNENKPTDTETFESKEILDPETTKSRFIK